MGQKQEDVAKFLQRGRKRKGGAYTASQTGAAQIAKQSGGYSQREPSVDEMIQRAVPEYGSKSALPMVASRKRPSRKSRIA